MIQSHWKILIYLRPTNDRNSDCVINMQVREGTCVAEFLPRPDMRVPFFGNVTELEPSPCIDDTKSRREDGIIPKFGNNTPTINSEETDIWDVAIEKKPLAYDNVATLYGSVKVPVEQATTQYLPTTATLDFLIHSSDTRLQAEPLRYFP